MMKRDKPSAAQSKRALSATLIAVFLVAGGALPSQARTHRHSGAGQARGSSRYTNAPVVTAGSVASAVDSWLNRPEIIHSRVGVEVMELPSGRIVYSHDGQRRLTPASTAKVMTTACAYELLGPNYQYKTTLDALGPVVGGAIKGDLVLQPSQDPTFSRSDLMKLVDDLKNGKMGERINAVEGHAFVGEPAGGKESFQPTWLAEDFGQDWMPASSSLVIDSNIAYASGFPKQFKVADDRSTGYAMLDSVLSSGEGSMWATFDAPNSTFHVLRGAALNANGKNDPAAKRDGPFVVANPDAFNQALFQATLADHSINLISGQGTKSEPRTVAEHLSKPLSGIIKHCLYQSDNLYAQQLLRTIGATTVVQPVSGRAGNEKTGSISLEDRGLNKLADWLSGIGVPNSEVVLFDGCGLSRKDCVSPHSLNLVLKHMAGPEVNGPYLSLMHQTGGKDGSGRFCLKTGAMDTVRGITGVLNNFSGQHLAVTAIINGHTPSVKNVRMALGDLIERLKRVKVPPADAAAGSAVKASTETALAGDDKSEPSTAPAQNAAASAPAQKLAASAPKTATPAAKAADAAHKPVKRTSR